MKEKKHIDQLFKERFENFEATPSPQVWDNIQAKIKEEEKDRKIIPLWVKLGGVAALLALILTVGNSVFGPTTTPSITEEKTEINSQDSENNNVINKNNSKKTEVVSEDNNHLKDAINNSTNENEVKSDSHIEKIKKNATLSGTEIAYEDETKKASNKNENNSEINIKEPANKTSTINEAVVENDVQKNTSDLPSNTEKPGEGSLINKEKAIPVIDGKEAVVENEANDPKNKDAETIPSETENKETDVAITEETNKRSIFDAIEETNDDEAVVETKNNKPDNYWEITPNVGPVYYNSLSDGSSIDPSFSDNPKSGELNITYGVQVSYNLNNRISVRSGLSNVNLSYATTGIELGNGPVSVALKSVDYDKRDNVIIAVDKGALADQSMEGEFGTITPKSTSGEPSINQKISYYEVPLELKYALLNKKFGVNLIGGFSTLFLGENEIFVDAGDFNETLGEANNLSTLSFTTNIGLGLNYSFSKKLMFNIEPMFKYQLNPYTESSVDFKPYYIGIYTGLSFKF